MRVIFGDRGRVDFDAPFEVTKKQINELVAFFKSIYDDDVVEVEELEEEKNFRKKRLGEKPGHDIRNGLYQKKQSC